MIDNITITHGHDVVAEEMGKIKSTVEIFAEYFCLIFHIKKEDASMYLNELLVLPEVQNYMIARTVPNVCSEYFHKINTPNGDLAAPGTILNGFLLYVLIRNFNIKKIFESGTASGFYTSFLLLAAIKNGGHVDTVDVLSGDKIGASIIYDNSPNLSMYQATDSLAFLKEKNLKKEYYDLYCHDSLHTFHHMTKELLEFKKCDKGLFFVFYDDQRSENFWDRCILKKIFEKNNYDVRFTTASEQLGGFLGYTKV